MTIVRVKMSNGHAPRWLWYRGRVLAENGPKLSMTTVVYAARSRCDDAVGTACQAPRERYRLTAELLGAELCGAAGQSRSDRRAGGWR